MTLIRAAAGGVMLLCATAAIGQGGGDVFYGGTLGASFGEVDYYEFAPMAGVHISPQFSLGGTLIYRHRRDGRFAKTLTANDYGASAFGRYRVTRSVFAQAEYEYLDYEFFRGNLSKARDTANSLFLGGGVSSPAGRSASIFATALYNVLHDDDSPYESPWVLRVGIAVGF